MRYILILCMLICPACTGAIYYVANDGNNTTGDGSIGTPWETIQYGTDQLVAGDTLYVRGGRYYEYVNMQSFGSEGSYVTVAAYQDEVPILDGTESISGWTQCASDEAGLTVLSVTNPNYANIYKVVVASSALPSDLNDLILYEDSEFSRLATEPEQPVAQTIDTDLMLTVPAVSDGLKAYLEDSGASRPPSEADDYWNGAWIDIWSHGANNVFVRRRISDHIFSTKRLYFDTDLTYALDSDSVVDTYMMTNHPHILDTAGEYYIDIDIDGGNYTIYLWPAVDMGGMSVAQVEAYLDANTTVPTKSYGLRHYSVYTAGDRAMYFILDGFTVLGYLDNGIYVSYSKNPLDPSSNAIIRNCIVHDTVGTGIFCGLPNSTIEDCNVYRTGNYGIRVTGDDNILQRCYVGQTIATNISYTGVNGGRLLHNTMYGSSGVHGSGMTVYDDSNEILIAYNKFTDNEHTNRASFMSFGANVGNIVILANIADESAGNLTLNNYTGEGQGQRELWFMANNTWTQPFGVQGSLYQEGINYTFVNNINGQSNSMRDISDNEIPMDRGYNAWLEFGWQQVIDDPESIYYFPLGTDIDATAYDWDDIWTDKDNFDFTLKAGHGLITGEDIIVLLENTGVIDSEDDANSWFPGFDFTKDAAGNTWSSPPSIGAYDDGGIPPPSTRYLIGAQ